MTPLFQTVFNWDCVDMIVIFCIERSHVVWLGKASCWKNILHKDRFCRFSDSSVKYLLLWLWWCFLKPFCFLNQAKFWFRKKTSAPIMEGHTYYTLENSNFPSAKDRNKPVFLKKMKERTTEICSSLAVSPALSSGWKGHMKSIQSSLKSFHHSIHLAEELNSVVSKGPFQTLWFCDSIPSKSSHPVLITDLTTDHWDPGEATINVTTEEDK